jgi:hypothetical protein
VAEPKRGGEVGIRVSDSDDPRTRFEVESQLVGT